MNEDTSAQYIPSTKAKLRKNSLLFWGMTCGGAILMVLAASLVDLKWLHERAETLNSSLLFVLMAVLPLAGMPVSILYVVAGARFGQGWGLLAAAAAIVFHLFASWWIAHGWLKRPLEALMRRFNRETPRVPEGEYAPVCLLVALMPGASYTLKNYLIVLGGVPFRTFFLVCLPVHLLTASLGIFFGGFTSSMTPLKVAFLVAYAALLFGISRWVLHRLKHRKPHTASGGQEENEI